MSIHEWRTSKKRPDVVNFSPVIVLNSLLLLAPCSFHCHNTDDTGVAMNEKTLKEFRKFTLGGALMVRASASKSGVKGGVISSSFRVHH